MNVQILRDTLELTLARDDTFPTKFYLRLFSAHPQTQLLFHRSSPGAQNKMFAQKLAMIVDHLDDPTWLERELHDLAANHKQGAALHRACGSRRDHSWTAAGRAGRPCDPRSDRVRGLSGFVIL